MRSVVLALFLVVTPSTAFAQFSPAIPGVTCDSTGVGGCAIYRVTPQALQWNWRELEGKRVRLQGLVTLQCRDQTLYFSRVDADSLRREMGLALSFAAETFVGFPDSLVAVEVEGVFSHEFDRNVVKRYGGILVDVRLVYAPTMP
jgi:hypothetical protein